jgi:hypothetical protein
MIDAINPISGPPKIQSTEFERIFPSAKNEPQVSSETAPVPADRVELSASTRETTKSEASQERTSDLNEEEAKTVGENWYRYGFSSAYKSAETGV